MRTVTLTYPTRQIVSSAKIVGWHQDLVSDGKLEPAFTLDEMLLDLEDAGVISVDRRDYHWDGLSMEDL